MATVVMTDATWPDVEIEQEILSRAGHRLVKRAAGAGKAGDLEAFVAENSPQALMVTYSPITPAVITASPNLRHIARVGIGTDNVAIDAATERGILVTNVPDYCIEEVSDHALALALALTRGLVRYDRDVKSGKWGTASEGLRRTSSLIIGVIGYGRIGRATARKAAAFGATVLAQDVMPVQDAGPATIVSLEELLAKSDVVILHTPLAASTHHMVDRNFIAAMRSRSVLINVSRGPLVDNDALVEGLQSGKLAGVGLDVVEGEPNPPRALVDRDDVIVTPHIAYASDLATVDLRRRASEEVVRVLAGERPRNPVNNVAVRAS
jgi:D-3-phosphoglycerate dehydrogenase